MDRVRVCWGSRDRVSLVYPGSMVGFRRYLCWKQHPLEDAERFVKWICGRTSGPREDPGVFAESVGGSRNLYLLKLECSWDPSFLKLLREPHQRNFQLDSGSSKKRRASMAVWKGAKQT